MVLFVVQIMAIPGILFAKIIAKVVILFQISYCIEHIYNVYGMKHVQTYLYLLNCLDPVLDTLPTYTYLVLLYI